MEPAVRNGGAGAASGPCVPLNAWRLVAPLPRRSYATVVNNTGISEEEAAVLAGAELDGRNRSTADVYCEWRAGLGSWPSSRRWAGLAVGRQACVASVACRFWTCLARKPKPGRHALCRRHGGRGARLPRHLDVQLQPLLLVSLPR